MANLALISELLEKQFNPIKTNTKNKPIFELYLY